MGFKFNPFTGNLDLVTKATAIPTYGKKFDFHQASLAAYDKVVSISYLDSGLRTQRIATVNYSSVLFPNTTLVKTIFWLDVGLINQRIDKIEYSGAVFSPDSLRKVFSYTLVGTKYSLTGFNYELF